MAQKIFSLFIASQAILPATGLRLSRVQLSVAKPVLSESRKDYKTGQVEFNGKTFDIYNVCGDGDCMFRALANQEKLVINRKDDYKYRDTASSNALRARIVDGMTEQAKFFLLESQVEEVSVTTAAELEFLKSLKSEVLTTSLQTNGESHSKFQQGKKVMRITEWKEGKQFPPTSVRRGNFERLLTQLKLNDKIVIRDSIESYDTLMKKSATEGGAWGGEAELVREISALLPDNVEIQIIKHNDAGQIIQNRYSQGHSLYPFDAEKARVIRLGHGDVDGQLSKTPNHYFELIPTDEYAVAALAPSPAPVGGEVAAPAPAAEEGKDVDVEALVPAEEAAAAAAQKKILDDQAAAQKKKLDDEASAEKKQEEQKKKQEKKEADAAAAAKLKKKEEDAAKAKDTTESDSEPAENSSWCGC